MKYLAKKEKKKGKYRKERAKKQAAVDTEEIRTKDFFDCVAPGVVKFFADSYDGRNQIRIYGSGHAGTSG